MAYNKAKAEKEWIKWKQEEEKLLRELEYDENFIAELREYDWTIFKSDRRYYEHKISTDTLLDFCACEELDFSINNAKDLLDSIEDIRLHNYLKNIDSMTLEIIVCKINGLKSQEISDFCGLSVSAVNFRLWHFRKKLKIF